MNTLKQMQDEILTMLSNGEELEDIKDNSGEFIEGYIPVYYNQILKEWADMPSEYNDRGLLEFGHMGEEITIFNLMSLDLYVYYQDIFNEAIEAVESELADSDYEAEQAEAN